MADRPRLSEVEAARVADVFTEHRRLIESVAVAQVNGDREAAAEIVQDVGLRLARHLHRLRSPEALTTWLYRLTVNAARDRYDARRRDERFRARARDLRREDCDGSTARGLAGASGSQELDEAEIAVDDRTPAPDALLLDRQRRTALLQAIRRLPAEDRTLLRRMFGVGREGREGGTSLRALARDEGEALSTMRRRTLRAMDRLRARLQTQRGALGYERDVTD